LLLLPKHQALRFFQSTWLTPQTSPSNHFFSFALNLALSRSYHSSIKLPGVGSWKGMFSRCLHQNHTSLACTHWSRMCSTVSSSCRQTKQAADVACNPCLNRRSDVQILYLAANHMNCLHLGVALLLQMASASAKCSLTIVSIP
jgi:hypothetical protein